MTSGTQDPITINTSFEFSQSILDKGLKEMFPAGLVVVLTRNRIEIEDGGYVEQPFLMSTPQALGQEARVITNSEEIRFGPWREDVEPVDGWEIRAEGGADWLVRGTFIEQPRRGQELFIGRRRIILGIGKR